MCTCTVLVLIIVPPPFYSELRYSQSHTLGPGGAIVTFLKACHLAQEELLKEPGQRVQWLSAGTTSSISSIPVASSSSLPAAVIVDSASERLPLSDYQSENPHINVTEDRVETELIEDLKPADKESPSTVGVDSVVVAEKGELVDNSPSSIAEGSVEDESEDAPVASITPISLDSPTDLLAEDEIATLASSSESTSSKPVEVMEDKTMLADTVEPLSISVSDEPQADVAVEDARFSISSLLEDEIEQSAKNTTDDKELERQENLTDDIIIDSAVAAVEVSDFRTEPSSQQLSTEEQPNRIPIEQSDEQEAVFDSVERLINNPVEEADPYSAAPVIPEPQFSSDLKPAANVEEIFSTHPSSIESTFPESPPKGNSGDVPSKLSPLKEVAVKKFAPSLSLSDASNLFGGAADFGAFGNASQPDVGSSIFQMPDSTAMHAPKKPLFPSSTTVGNPFDSAPPATAPLKPVNNVRFFLQHS